MELFFRTNTTGRIEWDPTSFLIPKTRAPIFDTKKYSINFSRPHKATKAGDGRIRIDATVAKSPPPVGSVLVSYGTHPTSRLCPAIHLSNSTNVSAKNVTIYDAGGMGVIAERTKDINIDRLTVTSTKERLVSTRADATHFVGCQGQLRLENCLFEHMLDDGINVHGAYVKVCRLSRKSKLPLRDQSLPTVGASSLPKRGTK